MNKYCLGKLKSWFLFMHGKTWTKAHPISVNS